MLAEISDVKDNEIELKIREEDISILYIIQHELLKQKSTDFAGIIQEHPLTKEYRMSVLTRNKDADRKEEQLNDKVDQDGSLKVMDGDTVEALPTTSIECPQCKNNTAFWWMLQTRSADEATTQFYRCTKCNHTWRNYS